MTAASTTPPSGGPDEGTAARTTPEAATTTASDPAGAEGGGADGPPPGNGDPGPGPDPAAAENRFFLWLRALDLPRRPGWIGGVCAGIAERLGIDPLIVRGVFVVVAVLGGPAFLFYAAAWLLLPDEDDALPIARLARGELDRVHAAIGVLVLASLLPVAQGFWSLGGAYTGATPWAPAAGRGLWTAVVVGLIIAFVVWIVRRSGRADGAAEPEQVPATTDGRPESVPFPTRPTDARPESPEDVAAWRERQEEWKTEREAFRAQQAATARETARERAEESRLRAAAATAARLERQRIRRAANPRLGFGATLLVLGAATLVGALVSLTASGTTATVAGFASAALVLALAIVTAGFLRRRAVLLVLASLVAVVTAGTAALLPPDRELVSSFGVSGLSNIAPGRYANLTGDLSIVVDPALGNDGGVIDLWQGAGTVSVVAGSAVRLEASSSDANVWLTTLVGDEYRQTEPEDLRYADGRWHWTQTFGDPEAEPFVVRIEQGRGSITVLDETGVATSGTTTGTDGTAPTTGTDTGSTTPTTTEPTEAAR
ncbi:phage shock protein C (PspC) family protein [Rathayibacter oskolensis]|uniref:Phage shock protein C (PspC) family protein n=1 Tax=Rathayibacter oskolensis TaxID=1891671 RepID=A0A1X7PDZ9_9MICO|nr:PspC domain-containing protein [Rathayibacter oskolensis]SMH49596.1 phage shock protein C (PspC) family protein [Rathayibacter oskolensis]